MHVVSLPFLPSFRSKENSTHGAAALRDFDLVYVADGSLASHRYAHDARGMSAMPPKATRIGASQRTVAICHERTSTLQSPRRKWRAARADMREDREVGSASAFFG